MMKQRKIDSLFAQLTGKAANWYASVMHTQHAKDWAEVGNMFRQFGVLDQDMVNSDTLYICQVENIETVCNYFLEKKWL